MKLYDDTDPAPNPRRVRLLINEKKITDVEIIPTPITKRAHKAPEHVERNPLGQVPTLLLPDGSLLIADDVANVVWRVRYTGK